MNSENWMLIRGARQLLTMHCHSGPRRGRDLAELGVIVDGSVLLRDGIIIAVGPTRRIENMSGARHAEEIDASGRVVMPAFIDPHSVVCPVPGAGQDAARVVRTMPASRLDAQSDRLLRTMARHGTGTVASLTGNGAGLTGELKILRALQTRHRNPLDVIPVVQLVGQQRPDVDDELLATAMRRKLAGIAAIRSGEGARDPETAVVALRKAKALGYQLRLELGVAHDLRLASTAVELGALSIAFAGQYRVPELEVLSGAATFGILIPMLLAEESQSFGRELIDSGALVALGSGLNPESGPTASMQLVLQTACRRCGLSLEEAISAATINAAWAVGAGSWTGSLEHGKSGDVLLLNASDYRDLALLAGTNFVHMFVKRGVVLFEEDFPGWPRPLH